MWLIIKKKRCCVRENGNKILAVAKHLSKPPALTTFDCFEDLRTKLICQPSIANKTQKTLTASLLNRNCGGCDL